MRIAAVVIGRSRRGAHGVQRHSRRQRSAKAYAISFHDGGLYLFGHLSTDTPVVVAKDLDHDGWVDAIAEVNTERPSYAAAPRYWATFVSTGHKLMSTGCTTPTMRPQRVPSSVITGDCAAA